MIRGILTDYGGVIGHIDREGFFNDLSLQLDTSAQWLKNKSRQQVRRAQIDRNYDFWGDVGEATGLDPMTLKETWLNTHQRFKSIDSDVVSLYASLHVPVVVLSNVASFYSYDERELPGIQEHVCSYHVGARKPDRTMYSAGLEILGTSPSETLFIDDETEHVDAARSLGFHAHRFTDIFTLEDTLRSYGVYDG